MTKQCNYKYFYKSDEKFTTEQGNDISYNIMIVNKICNKIDREEQDMKTKDCL